MTTFPKTPMAKMATASTLLCLLFLILAGSCIIMIAVAVVLVTTPLQGAVIVQSIALPGHPDFSNEEDWIDQVVQPAAPRRDLRKWLMCVVLWVIAGLVLLVLGIQYNMRQCARTKRQHYMLNQPSMAPEQRALYAAEEAWSAACSEQDKNE
jgi:hypothetical protein